ncbi:NACHT and WD repeat domain-containing protein 2-like [Tubulanus polymorphus]|uniref:NACHT and WD repeat domain-containing protein 2-like n=1 Tax=Tubulanus polymorphus TaxID=672921 RepID=UPI003DA6BA30
MIVTDLVSPYGSGKTRNVRSIHSNLFVTEADLEKTERFYRYNYLPNRVLTEVKAVLHGVASIVELPESKPKLTRIFICSNSIDTVHERNAIMSDVYPRLRNACREQYGLEIQVRISTSNQISFKDLDISLEMRLVDMHFGRPIHEEHKPKLMKENIRQLLHCKESSNGLNFMAIVGQRYGERPVPEEVSRHHFEPILQELEETGADTELLHAWYKKDQNKIPSVYVLQKSVSMKVMRSIHDIDMHLADEEARAYVDSRLEDGNYEIDMESYKDQNALRGEIEASLPSTNLKRLTIAWDDIENAAARESYLTEFGNSVYSSIMEIVERGVKKYVAVDNLYEDVLHHWKYAKYYATKFYGRSDELERIRAYLSEVSDKPLVISGPNGVGKTALMSYAASKINSMAAELEIDTKFATVLRFVRISDRTTNIHQVLLSLSHQIAYITDGYRSLIPTDYRSLKKHFMEILHKGDFSGVLVLMIDGLELISREYNGYLLDWLPAQIAGNVKVIVSAASGDEGIIHRIISRVSDPNQFIELKCPSPEECLDLLKVHLEDQNSLIQYKQCEGCLNLFKETPLPLFVTLLSQVVEPLRSYEPFPDCIPSDMKSCCQYLFTALEQKHGKLLVSHILSFITATQYGISYTELEDLLSLDDAVLGQVYKEFEPVVRRIPAALYLPVLSDIQALLMETTADGMTVITWTNNIFRLAAEEHYMNTPNLRHYIQILIIEYFAGKWSGDVKKPFTYDAELRVKLEKLSPQGEACRYIPFQPDTFTDCENSTSYNLRKLNQLPYHLSQNGYKDYLKTDLLLNFEWIYNKLRATSVHHVLSDYTFSKEREIIIMYEMFHMAESTLINQPELLAFEISSRLLPHYHSFSHIKNLIDQCDLMAMKFMPIVPNYQICSTPGGPLQYIFELDKIVKCSVDMDLLSTPDKNVVCAKPYYSSCMQVWDVVHGLPLPDVTLPAASDVYPTPGYTYFVFFNNWKFLQIYKADTGHVWGEVNYGYGKPNHISMSEKYLAFTIDKVPSPYVFDLDEKKLIHKLKFQSTAVAISPDSKYLACNAGQVLAVFELPIMERKCVVSLTEIPKVLCFSPSDSTKIYSQFASSFGSISLNVAQRKGEVSMIMRDMEIKEFILSFTEQYLLVRCLRCLFLFELKSEKLIHRIQQMPKEVVVEAMSPFTGAAFTRNDEYIVGSRFTYVVVWDRKTGVPIRLLPSSVSPIVSMYSTYCSENKVVTLSEDNTMRVWNMDNLLQSVEFTNQALTERITSITWADNTRVVACLGDVGGTAAIVDATTGACISSVLHPMKEAYMMHPIVVSPDGKFIVTRGEAITEKKYLSNLNDDVLWDMSSKEKLLALENCRHRIFNATSTLFASFQVRLFTERGNWGELAYSCVLYKLPFSGDVENIDLPRGDIISKPFFMNTNIVYLSYQKVDIDEYKISLCIVDIDDNLKRVKAFELSDIWNEALSGDNILAVYPVPNEQTEILIVYAKNYRKVNYFSDGSVNYTKDLVKGCLIYDLQRSSVLKHFKSFLRPNSDLSETLISRDCNIAMDQQFQVFNIQKSLFINKLSLDVDGKLFRFIVDGKYVAYISSNSKQLKLVRSEDGVEKGSCHLHGRGLAIEVYKDDRTVAIGMEDGRLFVVTVILDLSDPVREVVSLIPSRMKKVRTNALVAGRKSSMLYFEQLRFSQKIAACNERKMLKSQPSFKTLATGVIMLQKTNNTSRACSIQ